MCVVDARARELDAGQLAALRDLAGQAEQLLASRREHAQLLEVLAEVDHHASHDMLTGLVNRRLLLDRLGHALHRADRAMHLEKAARRRAAATGAEPPSASPSSSPRASRASS